MEIGEELKLLKLILLRQIEIVLHRLSDSRYFLCCHHHQPVVLSMLFYNSRK